MEFFAFETFGKGVFGFYPCVEKGVENTVFVLDLSIAGPDKKANRDWQVKRNVCSIAQRGGMEKAACAVRVASALITY